jgi:hypothetical protein
MKEDRACPLPANQNWYETATMTPCANADNFCQYWSLQSVFEPPRRNSDQHNIEERLSLVKLLKREGRQPQAIQKNITSKWELGNNLQFFMPSKKFKLASRRLSKKISGSSRSCHMTSALVCSQKQVCVWGLVSGLVWSSLDGNSSRELD